MIETSTTPDRGWMGDRRRGASFGRPQVLGSPAHRNNRIRFHLRRVQLDSYGYDPGGAYWGLGYPLFEAWDDGGEAYLTFRTGDREAAKETVRCAYPNAVFYR
jgi:hypothetical protein